MEEEVEEKDLTSLIDLKALSKTSKSFKILEAMLGNDQEVVSSKNTDFVYSVTF